MRARWSTALVERHLSATDYHSLVELSSLFRSSQLYSADKPDYGLPHPLFVFTETLLWFAQSISSGVWTYFEATPTMRQSAMYSALQSLAPRAFAEAYETGMLAWRDAAAMESLDTRLESHEAPMTMWLHELARAHQPEIVELVC